MEGNHLSLKGLNNKRKEKYLYQKANVITLLNSTGKEKISENENRSHKTTEHKNGTELLTSKGNKKGMKQVLPNSERK